MTKKEKQNEQAVKALAKLEQNNGQYKAQYILNVTHGLNGKISMNRTNDGFNGFEILGFIRLAEKEIIEMLEGKRKPDEIKSTVIDRGEDTK